MKTKAMIIASLLFTLTAGAQTVNVHLKSGEVVKYESSEFDYIDFSATGPETPVAYTECPDEHHPHMIDLGLPSGTKWACCNVGASTPEGYGDYFAWGETSPKSVYNLETYQYGNSLDNVVNIGSDIAGTNYDAATANLGAPWQMPSEAQIQELLDNCTSTWTTQNGVKGRKLVGSNGATVFLPAARFYDGGELNNETSGDYWSSTLNERYPNSAHILVFYSFGGGSGSNYRFHGRTIRPVRQ